MVVEDSSLRHKIQLHFFSRLITILLNYIKFLPLTYFFGYIMLSFIVLLANTTYEQGFVKLVAFTLGIKNSDFELDINDISRVFVIWWFILGTLFQIISNLLKMNVSRYRWFLIFSITLLPPTILFAFNLNSILLPVTLYFLALASLAVYNLFSFIFELFEDVLNEF